MATIVNNPQPSNNGGNNMGFLIGVILIIVLVVFLIYFVLPIVRQSNVTPQINVPGKIDVNVNSK